MKFLEDLQHQNNEIDLKSVIPQIKAKVLHEKILVLSGMDPKEKTRMYKLARIFGAKVEKKVEGNVTTHVVATKCDTEAVNFARQFDGIFIVSPNWLWSCAEKWICLDEKEFLI